MSHLSFKMDELFPKPKLVILWICNIVLLLAVLNQSYGAPVFSSTSNDGDKEFKEAIGYLAKYGYFKALHLHGYADLVSAIKDLQVVLRVNQTGRLDEATMLAIRRPRCGVSDDVSRQHASEEETSRVRRYTIGWSKWDKKVITYRILNYPNSDVTKDQVHDAMRRAFDKYTNVSRLEFKELTGSMYADIDIEFTSWTHGDGFPFDGPNGTVAHAYIPDGRYGDFDGDIHFDDSEDFTHEGHKGYNLYQVALHEIGHSLGLDHSWTQGAVMVPDYPGYYPEYNLAEDDIRAIKLLYGSGEPIPEDKAQNPDAECNRAFDATVMIDGQLFSFKDRRYWRTSSSGKLLSPYEGEPIKKRFPKLPRRIDAGYQRPQDNKVVLFKGSQHWIYDEDQLEPTYPRPISELGIPDNIDAAVMLRYYNKTYFFKSDQVWRYDEFVESVDPSYPHYTIDVWEGVPSPVHAAFDYSDVDGYTYFLQRKKYYRYSNLHRNADPGYPRYFGEDFIGCE